MDEVLYFEEQLGFRPVLLRLRGQEHYLVFEEVVVWGVGYQAVEGPALIAASEVQLSSRQSTKLSPAIAWPINRLQDRAVLKDGRDRGDRPEFSLPGFWIVGRVFVWHREAAVRKDLFQRRGPRGSMMSAWLSDSSPMRLRKAL